MPFGLTDASATFCILMKLFNEYLDKFVVLYLYDIAVYNKTLEEHVEHLQTVFKILWENNLYAKEEKCYFAHKEVQFLNHCIGERMIMIDDEMIRAIKEWVAPTKVTKNL